MLYVNALASEASVKVSLRETAALSRCPDLHAEVVSGPAAAQRWAQTLETLYARFSDRVEARSPGVAFLHGPLAVARELAAGLRARVGVADSLEVAHLAALRASHGDQDSIPRGLS